MEFLTRAHLTDEPNERELQNRQVAYEADEGHTELLKEVDDLVDEVWQKISGKDLSDCSACKDDKNEVK